MSNVDGRPFTDESTMSSISFTDLKGQPSNDVFHAVGLDHLRSDVAVAALDGSRTRFVRNIE
jgi:hypothetical protein